MALLDQIRMHLKSPIPDTNLDACLCSLEMCVQCCEISCSYASCEEVLADNSGSENAHAQQVSLETWHELA